MLGLLIVAFLILPFAGNSRPLRLLALALIELNVVGAIIMSVDSPRIRIAGGALTLIWFAMSVAAAVTLRLDAALVTLSTVLISSALLATFAILMRRGQGDLETLLGAIFGYLLLAMAWALLYIHIEMWQPGSFHLVDANDIWASLLYYSAITLTTVGYGDITLLSSLARLAAGAEAVVGVLYIAVMVGSIVGNLKAGSPH